MTGWEAVVSADRSQFERLRTDEVAFPGDYRERRFALDAPLMRIGRRRGRPDEPALEIDLAGAPEDPGSPAYTPFSNGAWTAATRSAIWARRMARWSTTTRRRSAGDTVVPLADGDRIRIGAWTTIIVRSR